MLPLYSEVNHRPSAGLAWAATSRRMTTWLPFADYWVGLPVWTGHLTMQEPFSMLKVKGMPCSIMSGFLCITTAMIASKAAHSLDQIGEDGCPIKFG